MVGLALQAVLVVLAVLLAPVELQVPVDLLALAEHPVELRAGRVERREQAGRPEELRLPRPRDSLFESTSYHANRVVLYACTVTHMSIM